MNRDVIFLATADEEQFGEASLKILIAKYWDKFAAGYAINEGGKVVVKNGKVQYVAIQAAEKVPVNVSVIAKGPSWACFGIPQKRIRWCIWRRRWQKSARTPRRCISTSITRRYFEGLAAIEDDEIGKWMRVIDAADRGEHAQRMLSDANPHVEFDDARHSVRQRCCRPGYART